MAQVKAEREREAIKLDNSQAQLLEAQTRKTEAESKLFNITSRDRSIG